MISALSTLDMEHCIQQATFHHHHEPTSSSTRRSTYRDINEQRPTRTCWYSYPHIYTTVSPAKKGFYQAPTEECPFSLRHLFQLRNESARGGVVTFLLSTYLTICTLFLSYRSSDIYHSKPLVFVSELWVRLFCFVSSMADTT